MIRSRAWIAVALATATATASADVGDRNIELLDEVHALVAEHFVDPDLNGVDWERAREERLTSARDAADRGALQTVVNDMLDELRMSHTRLYVAEEPAYYQLFDIFRDYLADEIDARFDGEVAYVGIGIFTELVDGRHHITGIVDGAPGARADLRTGDAVLTADGEPFHPFESFRGKAATEVTLTVQRRPDDDAATVTVVPERIVPHEMFEAAIAASARIVDRGGVRVAYLRAWSYAGREMQAAVEAALSGPLAPAHALVLDVRGAWGGASPTYLNVFHRRVPVMEMRRRDGSVHRHDPQWRKPVVLLVDDRTRSGSELLAHGFRSHHIGPVVGSRTAGAVSGGKPFVLADGSLLYLAVGSVTVDGAALEGVGVAPDLEVAAEGTWSAGADLPLAEAIETAAGAAARARTSRR